MKDDIMRKDLLAPVRGKYSEKEYPALQEQMNRWAEEKPLQGIRVLDGTPVFANTLLKYAALTAGGAELTVGYSDQIPYDPEIIRFLQESGIPCLKNTGPGESILIAMIKIKNTGDNKIIPNNARTKSPILFIFMLF